MVDRTAGDGREPSKCRGGRKRAPMSASNGVRALSRRAEGCAVVGMGRGTWFHASPSDAELGNEQYMNKWKSE